MSINFNADVRDIYDINGKPVPRELGRGVYRDDTNELMAVCGPNFVPVQHRDVLDPILQRFEKQGYKLEERTSASQHALYDLQGKKGAFVSTKLADNGAVMRSDIILGDFIRPTGRARYLSEGEDTNFFRISVLNSHNGKLAVRANTSYLRLLCMNGMTQPHFSAGTYGKHTMGFSVKGMQAQLTTAMNMMEADADRFGLWARTKITVKQAEEMLKKTLAKLPNKANGDENYSESLVNKILERFRQEDQTVWGLFNAATWWQTHSDFKAGSNRLTATLGREGKVASMIRSKEWSSIEWAI